MATSRRRTTRSSRDTSSAGKWLRLAARCEMFVWATSSRSIPIFRGTCQFCRMGRTNLCENYSALGVTLNGAAAELVRVPSHVAFTLPADLPRPWGTLVEPLSCAVHGFDQIGVRLADRYLIYGAGTMGLMMAQLARHAGSAGVDMVDKNPARFALAKRLAADRIADSANQFERPEGWDVVIDATGAVPAIEDGLRRVGRGGTISGFGARGG